MLRLAPGPATIIDQVPFGRIYKDGNLIGTDQAMGIRDRRKLSFAGHVIWRLSPPSFLADEVRFPVKPFLPPRR